MSHFYRLPAAGDDLQQGDVFDGVPVVGLALPDLFECKPNQSPTGRELCRLAHDEVRVGMEVLAMVHRIGKAVVISQSCDAARSPMILMAPFNESVSVVEKAKELQKWPVIQRLATSLGEPNAIYFPGSASLGLSRGLVELDEAFTVPKHFLTYLISANKRLASLTERAIAFVQFRLSLLLSRIAQDDFAWPSEEDLELKLCHLNNRISTLNGDITGLERKAMAAEEGSDSRATAEADATAAKLKLDSLVRDKERTEVAISSLRNSGGHSATAVPPV